MQVIHIFNYANFLAFLRLKPNLLPERNLLVLDEGHSLESQLVEEVGLSLSTRLLRRFAPTSTLENITYGYTEDIEKTWLPFLCDSSRQLDNAISQMISDETKLDAMNYLRRMNLAIGGNWIKSLKLDCIKTGGRKW